MSNNGTFDVGQAEQFVNAAAAVPVCERPAILNSLAVVLAYADDITADSYAQQMRDNGWANKTTFLNAVKNARRKIKTNANSQERRLTTERYIELFEQWGYHAELNLLDDSLENNSERFTDEERSILKARIRDHGINTGMRVSVDHAEEAFITWATQNAYHPIREYLESLRYDGADYIGELASYFQDTTRLLDKDETTGSREISSFARWFELWVIGAVARVYEPYQNPMLVLNGVQEIGKSFFARWLCQTVPKFYYGGSIFPDNKDCRLQLTNTLVWEAEELGSTTRRADVDALKAFLTAPRVRLRKAFGHFDIDKPALSSFIGTVNPDSGFLVDPTGNRRFLICDINNIDLQYSEKINPDNLWAQAYYRYSLDDSWRMTTEERRVRDAQNETAMVPDPLREWFEAHIVKDAEGMVTFEDVWNTICGYTKQPERSVAMALASYARREGIPRERRKSGNTQKRFYIGVRLVI